MMNRFKYIFNVILAIIAMVGALVNAGCSSEEPASVATAKTSKRDEAGKKFPFPDASETTKGAAGSPNKP
jgi:hypothetical protein